MGFLTELAEQLGFNLEYIADVWLIEWSKKLTNELEKAEDEETRERLREYREDLRDLVLGMHELVSKLSFDKKVDPEVAERLRALLSVRMKR
jgi:hypothetical protein